MAALVSLIIVLTLSVVVVRIAAVMLTLTGVSSELARFQALSAFTGAGFTTQESEAVVQHPVRRRIIAALLRLGNAGIVSAVATLVLSFVQVQQGAQAAVRASVLLGAVLLLWLAARSQRLDRCMSRAIQSAMRRWTKLDVRDYAALLRLDRGYGITEMIVGPDDWLAGKTLAQLQLNREGINVIGLRRRDGSYVGCPTGRTPIREGDTLLLYGRLNAFEELDTRQSGAVGDRRHEEAVREQLVEMAGQDRQEAESERRSRSEGISGEDTA